MGCESIAARMKRRKGGTLSARSSRKLHPAVACGSKSLLFWISIFTELTQPRVYLSRGQVIGHERSGHFPLYSRIHVYSRHPRAREVVQFTSGPSGYWLSAIGYRVTATAQHRHTSLIWHRKVHRRPDVWAISQRLVCKAPFAISFTTSPAPSDESLAQKPQAISNSA